MTTECRVCGSQQTDFLISVPAQMHPTCEEFAFSQCAECSYVFIDPPVDPAQLNRYYTDHYYPYRGAPAWGKYAATVARSDAKLDQKRVSLAVEKGGMAAGRTILDVGCGRPTFLRACRDAIDCRAVGLDFSDAGWISEDFSGIELLTGEMDSLPESVKPDVVTMWHYLEHDYDPGKTLRDLAARVAPEARLIIEVPDYDSTGRKKYGRDWAGWHTPRHISLFSADNLAMLLQKNGWEVVMMRRDGTLDPYVLDWMSRMERRGIDWTKSFEGEFVGFVVGMIGFWPRRFLQKGLGLLTAVARPAR
jgi:2-polyprenyl-3-methyl-5-hydroxy-6-metoxy-1,4-benzoquinol methylase